MELSTISTTDHYRNRAMRSSNACMWPVIDDCGKDTMIVQDLHVACIAFLCCIKFLVSTYYKEAEYLPLHQKDSAIGFRI